MEKIISSHPISNFKKDSLKIGSLPWLRTSNQPKNLKLLPNSPSRRPSALRSSPIAVYAPLRMSQRPSGPKISQSTLFLLHRLIAMPTSGPNLQMSLQLSRDRPSSGKETSNWWRSLGSWSECSKEEDWGPEWSQFPYLFVSNKEGLATSGKIFFCSKYCLKL